MAVGVVDGFEAVQIQIEQRKRLPGLLLFLQGRVEESLVGKAGQAVGVGKVLHLLPLGTLPVESFFLFRQHKTKVHLDTPHQRGHHRQCQECQQEDGDALHFTHSGVHHVPLHDAHNGQVLEAHGLVHQIIVPAFKTVGHTAAAALQRLLLHLPETRLVHLCVGFQIIKQVFHPGHDLTLGLFREHDIAVGVDDVAVAPAAVGPAADHLFNGIIIIADRQAGVGDAAHGDGFHRYCKHDLADPTGRRITGNDRFSRHLQRRKHSLDVFTSQSLTAVYRPVIAVLIRHIKITVVPGLLFLFKVPPLGSRLGGGHLPQVTAPVREDIPVALGKHGKGLVHLFISLQHGPRALVVDLLPDVERIKEDAHGHEENESHGKVNFFFVFTRFYAFLRLFHRNVTPPGQKMQERKSSAHYFQYTRFPESVNARFFQNLDKKFYVFAKSLPFFGVCVSLTCMLQ